MQIRIIIQWSPRPQTPHLDDLRRSFQQIRCRLFRRHREILLVRENRLALRCPHCGWESPGWTVSQSAPWQRQIAG
jgi:hypothetical protein